jgi:hypothetical protein
VYTAGYRTAALQELLAVNEFCELGRVCAALHANGESKCVDKAAKPSITHTSPQRPKQKAAD